MARRRRGDLARWLRRATDVDVGAARPLRPCAPRRGCGLAIDSGGGRCDGGPARPAPTAARRADRRLCFADALGFLRPPAAGAAGGALVGADAAAALDASGPRACPLRPRRPLGPL